MPTTAFASLAKNFNVSYSFLSYYFKRTACIRHRRALYRVTTRGFPILNLGRVSIYRTSDIYRLRRVRPISYVFVSPTHHSKRNKGAMTVNSYRPSVTTLRRLLLHGTERMLMGLSPVLSLALTLGSLGRIRRTRVISINGRYGRLLLLLKRNRKIPTSSVPVRYIGFANMPTPRTLIFAHQRRGRHTYPCAPRLGSCLCRPGTSILGTNTFHDLSSLCGIRGLRPGDRLCASSRFLPSFPNHGFQVASSYNFNGGRIGRVLTTRGGTGLAIHGFPTAITRLHGQLGLTRKKNACLFTAALTSRGGMLVHYRTAKWSAGPCAFPYAEYASRITQCMRLVRSRVRVSYVFDVDLPSSNGKECHQGNAASGGLYGLVMARSLSILRHSTVSAWQRPSAFTTSCWRVVADVGRVLETFLFLLLFATAIGATVTSRGTGIAGRKAMHKHVVSTAGRALPNTSVCVRGLRANIADSIGNFCAFSGLSPKACAMGIDCINCSPMRLGVAVPTNHALRGSIMLGRNIRLRRIIMNNTFRKRHHTVGSRGGGVKVAGMISTSRMNGFPSSGVNSTLGHVSNVGIRCSRNRTHFKRIQNADTSLDSIAVGNGHIPSTRNSAHGMRLSLVPTSVVRAVRIGGMMATSVSNSTVNNDVGLIAGGSPCGHAVTTATKANCG